MVLFDTSQMGIVWNVGSSVCSACKVYESVAKGSQRPVGSCKGGFNASVRGGNDEGLYAERCVVLYDSGEERRGGGGNGMSGAESAR